MKSLTLSKDLSVPLDIVTEALAWIGARGSGKTHGAGKLAEEFAAAGIPFVWLDPVGVAYGLRLAKDGKGPGLSIPVFGGLHGDIPLEPTAGALIADLIVDKNLSAILDVSQFDTDAQKARFTADFAERLFRRKKKDPSVIHWIVDEAQEFVPQNPQPGEQMMLHHMQRVLKLGRNFGIGVSLLTQRPQETSKKALNQCQTVFAFRVTGPQERKAMKDWIAAHDLDQSLVEKLPSLETGTCHVWSPAFLKVSKEIRILPKTTFDASATPKFGERRAVHDLAPIDLEKIKKEMAATIEKAKAEDPQALRAELQRLHLELARARHPIQGKAVTVEKRVEVPVLKDGHIKRLEGLLERAEKATDVASKAYSAFSAAVGEVHEVLRATARIDAKPSIPTAAVNDMFVYKTQIIKSPTTITNPPQDGMSPAKQRILDALAYLESNRLTPADKCQVAFFADASPKSSAYNNNVSALKTAGFLTYPSSGVLDLTAAGRQFARPSTVPQTTEALHAAVLSKLPPAKRRILEAVLAAYPNDIQKEQVAQESQASANSSAFNNNVSSLRSLGVIDYPAPGMVKATSAMFLEVA